MATTEARPSTEPIRRTVPRTSAIRRRLLALTSLLVAAAIWLPLLHLFFAPRLTDYFRPGGVGPAAQGLAERQLRLWNDPALYAAELKRMRRTNAEWDFMGRSYVAWGLANLALRDPARRDECLRAIDRIVDETVRIEKQEGQFHFMMPYARAGAFEFQPVRSVFVDGEIALAMAMRRVVAEKAEYREAMRERVDALVARMEASPVLCGESYPSECWAFCNTVALAAIRLQDYLDGTDHSAFLARWVATARARLTHDATGLLVSCFRPDGRVAQGPEGSSIWMAAHCMAVVDPAFARDQYERARRELGRSALGFAWAREWPASWTTGADVDSGPVVPWLDASAGASGLAFLGAATFGDADYLRGLLASLRFAGFPKRTQGQLKFCASNQVGDAVLFYAAMQGPVWQKVLAGAKSDGAAARATETGPGQTHEPN